VAKKRGGFGKAHTRYYLPSGKQVVGTTTVLGLLSKPQLVPWANKLGLDGYDVAKYVDILAEVGRCAHYLIQMHLQQQEPNLREFSPIVVDAAENSFLSYLAWEQKHHIEVLWCEKPLISVEFEYGGTPDVYCKLDDAFTLLDFKTGGVYQEHFYQVNGAYRRLMRENEYLLDQCIVLQIPRSEDERFGVFPLTSNETDWLIFYHLLEIHKLRKAAKAKKVV